MLLMSFAIPLVRQTVKLSSRDSTLIAFRFADNNLQRKKVNETPLSLIYHPLSI